MNEFVLMEAKGFAQEAPSPAPYNCAADFPGSNHAQT
jgi:hypothetical protein